MAEGARLEIVCSANRYRGFESLSLRHCFRRAVLSLGAVAQLGERQVRNLEVVGSIPICSTKAHKLFSIASFSLWLERSC